MKKTNSITAVNTTGNTDNSKGVITMDDTEVKVVSINAFGYQSYDDDFCSCIFGVDEDKV